MKTTGEAIRDGVLYSGVSAALAGMLMVFIARATQPPLTLEEYGLVVGGLTAIINGVVVIVKRKIVLE